MNETYVTCKLWNDLRIATLKNSFGYMCLTTPFNRLMLYIRYYIMWENVYNMFYFITACTHYW
jgi:hypothetical protein